MSKERELLERWVMQNNFAEYYALREESVTFLTQPEQEQEVYKKGYAQSELDLKPEDFSEEVALIVLKQICDDNREDLEVIHIEADKLLCALLEEKYPNLVKKFIELPKWYA